MIILQHLTYIHPDKDTLFDDIQLITGRGDKAALIVGRDLLEQDVRNQEKALKTRHPDRRH